MKTLAVAALAGAVCASAASAAPLDMFELNDPARWNCARRIAIRPFTLTGAFRGKRPQTDYMRQFAEELAAAIVGRAGIEAVFLDETGRSADADARIEGRWLKLSTGSRAMRFWVGFGAGAAWCSLEMSAISVHGNHPIFHIVHERGSAMGLAADELGQDVSAVVADVAEALVRSRGSCDSEVAEEGDEVPLPALDALVQVAIESRPEGAEVLLDGAFIGTTPLLEYRVAPGEHQLEFRLAGYRPWVRTIRISPGAPTRVDAALEAVPTAPPEPEPELEQHEGSEPERSRARPTARFPSTEIKRSEGRSGATEKTRSLAQRAKRRRFLGATTPLKWLRRNAGRVRPARRPLEWPDVEMRDSSRSPGAQCL